MTNNRLAKLFQEFASEFELLFNVSLDSRSAKLGIQFNNLIIQARIIFYDEKNSYQFGAVLKDLDSAEIEDFASKVLTSVPMTGLTERFLENKFVIMGFRDNLDKYKDQEVKNLFMEDVDKIRVYHQTHQTLY
ncbi:MAG: hypothetical protein J0L96_18440 [Anaerolineae bacterium]|nr:hypothetical protein [Anaerolineae bacterium]